ncbi:MAG TPA: DUF3108 domain-containing protein [Ferrovibrio sp.]|uniref:DUF3108 domain-containing protein n=1 Tax=Ferrovibrio sp. TaxID=1917215 RepID=UPI002ED00DA6
MRDSALLFAVRRKAASNLATRTTLRRAFAGAAILALVPAAAARAADISHADISHADAAQDAEPAGRPVMPVTSLEVTFGVYALGSKGFELVLSARRDADSLRIDTKMHTAGMLDWVMRFAMTGQAVARLDGDAVRPLRYAANSDGGWTKYATRMSWDADGQPIINMLQPPVEDDDREPVPEALTIGTSDPTSATIARALRGGATPACSGTDAIFDGRRRYDMHYTPLGPDWVKPNNRSAYSGPAFKCEVAIEPIAGYTREYLAERRPEEETPTTVWLAQPPGTDIWIPVQLEGGFRLGSASGWISAAKINGTDWLKPLGLIRPEMPDRDRMLP